MKKVLAYIMLPAMVLGACHKKDEKTGESVPEINVAKVESDSIVLYNDYPGYLQSKNKVNVVAEVSGKLLSINFTSGSYVEKGQVLFTIDPTKYNDAVTEAQASLANARSQREYYAKQTAAMEKAFKEDAVSEMELLESQSNLRQAEASIQSSSAALNNARTNLSKCTVRAPLSGYIDMSTVSPGAYINGEGAPVSLATIYDNSAFDAKFSIEDGQFNTLIGTGDNTKGALYENMPITFSTPLAHSYTADLYYIAPSVSSSTGALQLVGTVINKDNELKDGMYVKVSLPYGTNAHATVVKDAALSTDQLGKYLYLVNDSDQIVYTPVTTGPLYRDSLRVITKGVKPGDRYVTEALLTVRNGMKVKPVLK